ncbi:MAG: hypothetical protein RIS94_2204 [Pseudomonadota bacterium]|jgi:DNA invertase Pin-like site-specific DNA recombinase
MKGVRCAIYTRKSSEEGLEQGFNSLHAQREACAAYVLSQASEGWTLVPEEYDDGGLSGGTLERPALQRLLGDVAAGKVDIIVVYKVDRLTRSLLDFAKLVEALDKAGTSFVSITQSFNTTTSMGRLTLNMLLSFAQFEREVTAERIRDKLAASKAKGMWMGGVPPLGYRPDGRTLAIVDEHAELVRHIFARYRKLGTVRLLAEELATKGMLVPTRTTTSGKPYGGGLFSRGQLYNILKNPIYVGDIPHRDVVYPGNHPALIARKAWDAVQHQLAGNVKGERGSRPKRTSLLAGLLFDADGDPLLATHACKNGQRYRYYVSKRLQLGTDKSGLRLPAREIEQVVCEQLANLLGDQLALADFAGLELDPANFNGMMARTGALVADISGTPPVLPPFLERVDVTDEGISFGLDAAMLASALGVSLRAGAPEHIVHASAVRLTRTGRAIRLVRDNGTPATAHDGPDATLLRLIIKARHWWQDLCDGHLDPTGLAAREGITDSYVIRVVRLAFLSPRVLDAALAGRLAPGIDAPTLLKPGAIAMDWLEQEHALLPSCSRAAALPHYKDSAMILATS